MDCPASSWVAIQDSVSFGHKRRRRGPTKDHGDHKEEYKAKMKCGTLIFEKEKNTMIASGNLDATMQQFKFCRFSTATKDLWSIWMLKTGRRSILLQLIKLLLLRKNVGREIIKNEMKQQADAPSCSGPDRPHITASCCIPNQPDNGIHYEIHNEVTSEFNPLMRQFV